MSPPLELINQIYKLAGSARGHVVDLLMFASSAGSHNDNMTVLQPARDFKLVVAWLFCCI